MGIRAQFPRSSWLWIPCLLICATASAQTTRPATAPSVVEGRVYSADAAPIADARVAIYDESEAGERISLLAEGKTDAQGLFRLSYSPELAKGSASAARTQYEPYFGRSFKNVVVVAEAEGYGLCFFRSAVDAYDEPLQIEMPRATAVRLKVVDAEGRPAARARVGPARIQDLLLSFGFPIPEPLRSQYSQMTDDAGVCVIPNLPQEAEIGFEIINDLFVRKSHFVQMSDSETTQAPEPMIAELGGIIEGRIVLGDSGQPASGVFIIEHTMVNGRQTYSTTARTDAQGRYRLPHLRAGEHVLELQTPESINTQFTAWFNSDSMNLTAGQTLVAQDIKLPRGTAISGKVMIEETGEPLAGQRIGVSVQTAPNGSRTVSSGLTKPDGTYLIRMLPGIYRMIPASNEGLLGSASGPQDVTPVPIRPPPFFTLEEGKDVTFDAGYRRVRRTGVTPVKGIVVDEQGNPVEGARVTLSFGTDYQLQDAIFNGRSSIPMGDGGRTWTDAAGRFELPIAGNGALLRARKGDLVLAQPQAVGDNRDVKLTLSKTAGGQAVVQVVDDKGQPLAGVNVGIRVSDAQQRLAPRWGKTNADGSFSLEPVYAERNYTISVGGFRFTRGNTAFKADATRQVALFVLHRANSFISGIIVDGAGNPLADIQVSIRADLSGNQSLRTDARGRFRVEKLVAGETVTVIPIAASPGRLTPSSGVGEPLTAGTENATITFRPR